MQINLQQLKAAVEQGPPPMPTGNDPGPLTRALVNALEQAKASMDHPPTAEEAVILFSHTMDLLAWKDRMEAFEKCKALLEHATRKVQLVK